MSKAKTILYLVIGLAIGIALVRFGIVAIAAALPILIKVALPLVTAYVGYRAIRRMLASDRPPPRKTIDLCPNCGEILDKGHICK